MNNCIGIDVSKDTLQVAFLVMAENRIKTKASSKFSNNESGFEKLLQWSQNKLKGEKCLFVMEATGVYHENVLDYLYFKEQSVCVELPNKIKHFAKSLNIKSKTDKIDAAIIAQYGLERRPKTWKPMCGKLPEMRSISRMIMTLKKDNVRYKNRLAALLATNRSCDEIVSEVKVMTELFDSKIKILEDRLMNTAQQDTVFFEKVRKIATIKGIRELTIIQVLCETNGFFLMENLRQLCSYAGMDVVVYESGTIYRKGGISKKGNARVRHLLYLPALVMAHCGSDSIQKFYKRIVDKNPKAKKKAIVAVERKLLTLIYTLWKNDSVFIENYLTELH